MQYFVVDAVTDKLFAGNPAGVCLLDTPLPDATLQQIAAENNLAETAFLRKQANGYNLRWFTPEQEFDLCGHATLASAFVLFSFVEKDAKCLHFDSQSGPLSVLRRPDGLLELDFPARPPEEIPVLEIMSLAVGAPVLEAHLSRDMVLVLENEAQVAKAQPDLELVARIPDCVNMIITAKGETADFVSRYFTPGISIPEDPVTGSAHSTLIPFWSGRLGKKEMVARQLSQRGGVLYCRDAGARVNIAGQAVLYLRGEISL